MALSIIFFKINVHVFICLSFNHSIQIIIKLINNGKARGMVPRKEGEATNQTNPDT